MFRFIHTADIHLDSPLRGLEQYEGAPVEEIRLAPRRALVNLVDMALERDVDFVLIAGDLYDGDWQDARTGLFFVSQMRRLREASIPVIILHGNHDAANKMTRKLPWPENVEVLSHTRPQTANASKLRELGVAVHGRSFANPAETGNLVLDYPSADSSMFNIGMLHTSLTGAEGHEPYAPCTLDDLRSKAYDYWALGHVHQRDIKSQDPNVVYCGNLQGRHIRETGPKGCYLVSVDDGRVTSLDFQPLDVFRWECCRITADDAHHVDDLLPLVHNQLTKLAASHADLPLGVRVEITGSCRAHDRLHADLRGWTDKIHAIAIDVADGRLWVEKVRVQTSAAAERDGTMPHDGPIAELRRHLQQLIKDDQQLGELADELADLARKLPSEITRGDDGLLLDDLGQLRDWLIDVEPMLVSRLMEGSRS